MSFLGFLSEAFDAPRAEAPDRERRVSPTQWAEVSRIAATELAVRARPALATYLGLVTLAAWGSGVLDRRNNLEIWILSIAGVGLVVSSLLRQTALGQPRASADWWRGFGILTICNAALVGSLGVAMTLHHRMGASTLIYWLILAGTASAAATSLTPSLVLGRVFLWVSLGPPVIAAAWLGAGISYALPGIFSIFLAFMTAQARRASRAYWTGIISEVLLREQAASLDASRAEAQLALLAQQTLVGELQKFRGSAERDYAVAARIFRGILDRSCFQLRSIRATASPLERFNGDLVMATILTGGRIRLFLGDFTGHGLSAAVGALPIAEVFFSTAARSGSLTDVLREMNGVIRRNLPRGQFLAAFAADFDPIAQRLVFWNGGLPAPLIVGPSGTINARLASGDVALGVLAAREFDPVPQTADLAKGDRLFAYSDGVVEATNAAGELFGVDRLENLICTAPAVGFLTDVVGKALAQHRYGLDSGDDVTLLELRNDELLLAELAALDKTAPWVAAPSVAQPAPSRLA